MTGPPYGATPAEWAHFDLALDLTAHLLPVVSNPHAEISPQSKMAGLGKTPSHYNGSRKVAGIPKWTEKVSTGAEVAKWAKEPDYGICIQSRAVRALDIDVDDPELARRIELAFHAVVGAAPVRCRDGSGKRLVAFRLKGEFPKRSFRLDGGLVEFLADGQQFIAAGTHPSGARYGWVGGLPDDFPEIKVEDFERAWQALVSEFATAPAQGGVVRRRGETVAGKDDPVADWLLDRGLVLDEGRDGSLYVECPWIAEHTSDSGVTESAWFPAGSNGYEKGGYRCLHAHCDGRGAAEFERAVGYAGSEFEALVEQGSAGNPVEVAAPGFERDKGGKIEAILDNVMRAVEAPEWTGTDFAYDTFFGSIVLSRHGRDDWRPLEDADYVALRRWLERRGFKSIGRELIRDAVLGVAWSKRFDSAQDWLTGLKWDGVARVETMLADHFGVADSPYARAVGRYWMTAHAGRVLDPGCQADMVPVLVGAQNAGKSSAVAALSPWPDAFLKIDLDHKDADLSRKMRGKVIGELDELRGFKGRTAEANKAWVSQRFEEWTPKYQEFATKLQRRLVFVGTSNPDDFLDDPTGERRWLPFRVGTIDHAALAALREQLWAEGAVMFAKNGVEWQAAYELAKAEHDDFKAGDIWADSVHRWWTSGEWSADWSDPENAKIGFAAEKIAIDALGLSAAKLSNADCARLTKTLRACGFLQERVRFEGQRPRYWTKHTTHDQSGSVQGGD
jgi:hypothetical protein